MIKVMTSLLFLATFTNAYSQTDESIYVMGSSYSKGNIKSESLALSCVTFNESNECKEAQFVHYSNGNLKAIGPKIPIQYTEKNGKTKLDKKEFNESLNQAIPSLKARKETARNQRNIIFLTSALSVGLASGFGTPVAIIAGTYGAVLGILYQVAKGQRLVLIDSFNIKEMTKVLHSNEGWNWSIRQKRMKKKVFEAILNDLSQYKN